MFRAARLFLLAVAVAALSSSGVSATATDSESPRAYYRGQQIPLQDVARYHCHDGAHPDIRCFSSSVERDGDAAVSGRVPLRLDASPTDDTATTSASFYVTFYEHADYGGYSYTASQSISDLTAIGWNDAISSFKSLNGQRPKWWEHAGYVTPSWQWPAGAWVSNVGSSANDKFSAVRNVP